MTSASRRVLITGGFGYVGGRLAQHLAEASHAQIVLGTRHARPLPDWLATASVADISWQSDESLDRVCRGTSAIVHLAGMNAKECLADPVGALEVNGVTTARLLRAAISAGVKRFIYVSTAHVYGNALAGAISEQSGAFALHPYAASHRAGEDAVLFAHRQGAIQGIVTRLSNSFGPPASADVNCWMLLVNDLCKQAVTTRRVVLNSSGMQRRDFITLTDACRAIAYLLDLEAAQLGNGLYNVGGGWAPTVLEMTERISERCLDAFGFTPDIVPAERAQAPAAALDYRIDKLLNCGFTLTGNVDSEIMRTLEFCASRQRRGRAGE